MDCPGTPRSPELEEKANCSRCSMDDSKTRPVNNCRCNNSSDIGGSMDRFRAFFALGNFFLTSRPHPGDIPGDIPVTWAKCTRESSMCSGDIFTVVSLCFSAPEVQRSPNLGIDHLPQIFSSFTDHNQYTQGSFQTSCNPYTATHHPRSIFDGKHSCICQQESSAPSSHLPSST